MEVAAGPTVGLKDHAGFPAFFCGGVSDDDDSKDVVVAPAARRTPNGFCFVEGEEEAEKAEDSSESSSIGAPSSSGSDSDDSGHDEEAQSQLKNNPLGSLDSIEDALPIKRGLSNFFTGKSKSFASLSEAASSGDLAKPENPFNKRRRILMACKSSWSRRASFSTLLPPLADGDEEDEDQSSAHQPLPLRRLLHGGDDKKFRSPRSFSLSDLQHA